MRDQRADKLAQILVQHSTKVQKGDTCVIQASTAAEPLALAVYEEILKAGGHPIFNLSPEDAMASFYELASDERVLLLGEDIGVMGGAFRATRGLWERFGDDRVIDTPIAETALVGAAVWLAISGLRLSRVVPFLLPYIVALIASLMVITYVPAFSLWLPRLIVR